MGFVIRELLAAGLLHADVETVVGTGLAAYTQEPWLDEGRAALAPAPDVSGDDSIVPSASRAVQPGRRPASCMRGNLGRAVIKTSAVQPEHLVIEAPALVFEDQPSCCAAFKAASSSATSSSSCASRGRARTACPNCTS